MGTLPHCMTPHTPYIESSVVCYLVDMLLSLLESIGATLDFTLFFPNICPCSTSSSDANTFVADMYHKILIDLRSRRLARFRMPCDAMLCVAIIIGSPIDDATGSRASRHPIRLDSRMSGAARLGTCWYSHHSHCSAYRSFWRSLFHPPTMRPMPSTHQYASSFTTRSLGLAFSP